MVTFRHHGYQSRLTRSRPWAGQMAGHRAPGSAGARPLAGGSCPAPGKTARGRLWGRADDRVAVGGVGAEWAAALHGGGELGGLPIVELGARVVGAVGERRAGAVEREPGVGAKR